MRRVPKRCARGSVIALLLGSLCALPARGLESDQYFAWGRDLEDATDVINAKVDLEIRRALDQLNARPSWREVDCHGVVKRIVPRFRQFIFQDIEIWATKSSLVDRIPRTPEEELAYREQYIYHNTGPFDVGTKVPPSPTIRLNDVRFGTDKLSHFFSEGWWYYKWYQNFRRHGLDAEEIERRVVRRGILWERTVLGLASSGVFSPGDLEANFQGMRFMIGLCEGGDPALEKTEQGWRLSGSFDFRRHVTPEWDESYQPPVYGKRRWKKVRPVLLEYCPLLHDPAFVRQRQAYAARDRLTPTERQLGELVAKGRLRDSRSFSLEANCPDDGPESPTPPASGGD